jgi:type II secretory pathway pseudopilin PulG
MRCKRGFSLIETMFSVIVLSFAVLVFGAVFPASSRMRQKGEYVTRATTIAEQELEQIRGLGYAKLNYTALQSAGVIDSSPNSSPYSITGATGLATALPGGTGTLTITSAATDLMQCQINITWTGAVITQGNSVTLTTFIVNTAQMVKTWGS